MWHAFSSILAKMQPSRRDSCTLTIIKRSLDYPNADGEPRKTILVRPVRVLLK